MNNSFRLLWRQAKISADKGRGIYTQNIECESIILRGFKISRYPDGGIVVKNTAFGKDKYRLATEEELDTMYTHGWVVGAMLSTLESIKDRKDPIFEHIKLRIKNELELLEAGGSVSERQD